MYAIVDIETTGGYARENGITEIAIILHDGNEITEKYQTLINPCKPIPLFIQSLTGITDDMVSEAPAFSGVAQKIYQLLEGRVFIAHNVNFDYSFIKYNLSLHGFDLQVKKLCTVRLARKVLPGYPSYGLGKICKNLGIHIEERHRAMGDADATAKLFNIIVSRDTGNHIEASLKRNSKEQILPPNLSKTELDKIPETPGVYYFNDKKGKTIYVGKAKNLRKRVLSHFTGNNSGSQRQGFLKYIHAIKFESCGTELMALILEATEIKRLWPQFNRSMKRFEQLYGLFVYEDQKNQIRFCVDKKRKFSQPVISFSTLSDGYNFVRNLATEYKLCLKLAGIERSTGKCANSECVLCNEEADTVIHNQLTTLALKELQLKLPSFAVFDTGRTKNEKSCILIERGKLYGMGYIKSEEDFINPETLKSHLKPYPSNDYVKNLVLDYVESYPAKTVMLKT